MESEIISLMPTAGRGVGAGVGLEAVGFSWAGFDALDDWDWAKPVYE
jgi:hypothetical protein